MSLDPLRAALARMAEQGASDMHMRAHVGVYLRVGEELRREDLPAPGRGDVDMALKEVLSPGELNRFRDGQEVSSTYGAPDGARYRVSALRQRGSPTLVMRRLPDQVPDLTAMGLPDVLKGFPRLKRGLVLLTGPARAGKSTTMAALLGEYAATTSVRVLTLESPIEVRVPSGKGLIGQRQVGADTPTYLQGLRAASHQDPDVVVLGELPDAASVAEALNLATSGPLVYLVVSAPSAAQAVQRLAGLFPSDQRDQALARLSIALRAAFFQTLLPGLEPGSRVPAFELLVPDVEMRQRMKAGHFHAMDGMLEHTRGCFPLRASVARLVQQKLVRPEEVLRLLPEVARQAAKAAKAAAAQS